MYHKASINIVLLGHDWVRTNKVGNFLLGKDVFKKKTFSDSAKNYSVAFTEYVQDRQITMVSIADLFTPDISDDNLKQKVQECVSLCLPGPHALVLVVNPKDFDDRKRQRMVNIVNSFSEEAFQHSIVFVYRDPTEKEKTKRIIELCGGRSYHYPKKTDINNKDQIGALKAIEDMISEKGCSFVTCDKYEDAAESAESSVQGDQGRESQKIASLSSNVGDISPKRLNLVLCGSSTSAKASAADLILGKQTKPSPQSSSLREAEVGGRHVTLVLLSTLGKTHFPEEALWQETHHYLHFFDPGIHAFILVIPQRPMTNNDKKELDHIQLYFGKKAGKFYIHLYIQQQTEGINARGTSAVDLIETVEGPSFIVDTNFKVETLLDEIEKIEAENGYYTLKMYCAAQVKSLLNYKRQLTDIQRTVQDLQSQINHLKGSDQDLQEDSDNLRIVLLGKTGEGKSATANTILGRDVFKADFAFESVTTVCQKETAFIHERQITIIDTPGFFDTQMSNDEIKKDIIKCIGMAAPGPHAFVLVKKLGRFTQEERDTMEMIQKTFGDESESYTLVLFTEGDKLQGKPFKDTIKKAGASVKNLLRKCEGRYHVIDNTDKSNKTQITELLSKIDSMVKENGGKCYTNEMFQKVEEKLKQDQKRILKEREEEITKEKEELKAKHEAEMEKLKKEMEQGWERQEKERRRREEEFKRKEDEMKAAMQKLENDEKARHLEMKKDYEQRKKENEDWIQQRTNEINMARQRLEKEWEEKQQAEQQKRAKEEEAWKKKEEEKEKEWQEKQRQAQVKFDREMNDARKKSEQEEFRKKQEYEERVKKEEERKKELEEKIKHAEESKRRELEEQKRKHEEECQRNYLQEVKRKTEEEMKWKDKLTSMETDWQKWQREKEDKYQREKQEEKERRDAEEKERKKSEKEERMKIQEDADREIKKKEKEMMKVQEDHNKKLQEEERKIKEMEAKRVELEDKLRVQREQFEREKKETKEAADEMARKSKERLEEDHKKEKEKMRRDTEQAARMQAEKEFNAKLDEKVKKAKMQGFEEGKKEVEAQRTNVGRVVDISVKAVGLLFRAVFE